MDNLMKINVEPKEKYQAVICIEPYCKFKSTCANHTTAGDFRSEGGFSPELTVKDRDVHCATKSRDLMIGMMETVPSNYNQLDRGTVLWDDIVKKEVETNITTRWEKGINHHPKSVEIFKAIKDNDWKYGNDYFCWKYGGDGDNGEHLMYLLDIYFEQQDEQRK